MRVFGERKGVPGVAAVRAGGTKYWTTYTYDALGRTAQVDHPGGSGSTAYLYSANTVKVTDPAGKWKKYWMDKPVT
ncbi:MAG: hypothetical protein KIT09_07155 [Bryobacteraceae bacterium]|nr:hypothetical protein [Bryobacteraceae bacterium]